MNCAHIIGGQGLSRSWQTASKSPHIGILIVRDWQVQQGRDSTRETIHAMQKGEELTPSGAEELQGEW